MAAGHQPSPEPAELPGLEAWLRALQQALQVEADRGFIDLKGRQTCFSSFVVQQLQLRPQDLPAEALQRLLDLSAGFQSYGELPLARRQSLVRTARERLHALRQAQQPVLAVAPPRLRLVSNSTVAGKAPIQPASMPIRPSRKFAGLAPRPPAV